MLKTIRVTQEAREVLDRDETLRDLVDKAQREYAEFMGDLPLLIDAFPEEDSEIVKVYIAIEAPPGTGEAQRERMREFGRGWLSRNGREVRQAIGFSIHYL